ncbi:MAG: PQQ-like beta-propeller repeat protein [Verrucomicrobiae bacterium]|nr:PQQ-like beta-propeller repeat protein [Verrucomicrobiae bacterium]
MRPPRISGPLLLLVLLLAVSNPAAGADWPQWRGPQRDGHTAEPAPPGLDTASEPLWKKPVGHGYASPVVAGNTVVILDAVGDQETAHAVNAADGKILWSATVGPVFSDEFEPGPRSTPLVDGDRVYVQSAYGEFRCLGLADGAVRWRFHFEDYGARWVTNRGANIGAATRRGNTGSPVVDGDRILVQVGSTNGAFMVAFDKRTGRELWKSQNDLATYTSPVIGQLAGRSQCVTATCDGLLALDPGDGAPLWRISFKTGANRNVLTPVLLDDTVYFASHTTGLRATRVRRDDSAVAAEDAWLNRDLRINLSSPVAVGGHLYGLGANKTFVCVDRATGSVAWSQPGFGEVASTLATADGHLLVLTDLGELLLLKATPERYEEVGRRQVCGKTYSHPAYANGVLYVRDPQELVAWRLQSPGS